MRMQSNTRVHVAPFWAVPLSAPVGMSSWFSRKGLPTGTTDRVHLRGNPDRVAAFPISSRIVCMLSGSYTLFVCLGHCRVTAFRAGMF